MNTFSLKIFTYKLKIARKRHHLSRGGVSEPDFYAPIFTSAVLKYSQIH